MLIPVEPLARQPCIESQEWEGAKDILIKLQVVTMNMMRDLQHSMALRLVMVNEHYHITVLVIVTAVPRQVATGKAHAHQVLKSQLLQHCWYKLELMYT